MIVVVAPLQKFNSRIVQCLMYDKNSRKFEIHLTDINEYHLASRLSKKKYIEFYVF